MPKQRSIEDYYPEFFNMFVDKEVAKSSAPYSKSVADFICPQGHPFTDRITHTLVSQKFKTKGCPLCAGRKVVTGHNDVKTTHPEIAKSIKNVDYSTSLASTSHKKIEWMCPKGHDYLANCYDVIHRDRGCNVCSGRVIVEGFNDIATLFPDLARELADQSIATSTGVGTAKKLRWVCKNGHQYDATVSHRRERKGCPVCAGKKILKGFNDLESLNPELFSELRDKTLLLGKGSIKKVEWVCFEGHIWSASVNNRWKGRGCDRCSLKHTSKSENRLRILLSNSMNVINKDHTYKIGVPYRANKQTSVDIYIENPEKIVVEYDGSFFHYTEKSISRDIDKTNSLLLHGISVVRVRENPLPHLDIDHPNLLQLSVPYSQTDEHLLQAVAQIKEWLETK